MTGVEKKASEILGKIQLATIGLTLRDGTPHVFTAFIAVDNELNVYFISAKGSVHGDLLRETRDAAMAVYDSTQEWNDWKEGIQLWGCLRMLEGKAEQQGRRYYEQRFPEYVEWLKGDGKYSERAAVYRYEWNRIRVLAESEWGEEEFREISRKQVTGETVELGGG